MKGFALLWAKTLDSSIWRRESKETRLVWVTLLMMKDSEGVILSSKVGLADRAKVSEAECEEALRVLLAPDPNDTSQVEEGRRLRVVPGGWQIVNHDFYRFSTEAKRAFWREQKALQRSKVKSVKKGTPLANENAALKALAAGNQAEYDRLVTPPPPKGVGSAGLPIDDGGGTRAEGPVTPAGGTETIPLGSGDGESPED